MSKKRDRDEPETEEVSFVVDKERLDEEWVGQADFYHFWALELANARLELEQEKARFDLTRAELDRDIRSDPEDFDVEKITEKAIENAILLQPQYQKALRKVTAAKHKVDVTQAAVGALDHKKKALENLVYLHGQNYFSTPQAKGDSGKKMKEKADKKLYKRMQRDYEED